MKIDLEFAAFLLFSAFFMLCMTIIALNIGG